MVALRQTTRMQRTALVALIVFILASVTSVTIVMSHDDCNPPPPPIQRDNVFVEGILFLVAPVFAHNEPCEGGVEACDYGRNPETIWLDNPDGHPFERAFCDGIVGPDVAKHPLDTPENVGLYCDEVPGCWAYGLGPEEHHGANQ